MSTASWLDMWAGEERGGKGKVGQANTDARPEREPPNGQQYLYTDASLDDDQSVRAASENKLQESQPKPHFPRIACLYIDMSQIKSIAVDQHYTVSEVAELMNVHE